MDMKEKLKERQLDSTKSSDRTAANGGLCGLQNALTVGWWSRAAVRTSRCHLGM